MAIRFASLLSSLTIVTLVGCGGDSARRGRVQHPGAEPPVVNSNSHSRGDAPDWVMRTPSLKGNICAVGAVDPTFFRDDGRVNAGKAARGELARTVQVQITSVMYDEQTTRGGWVDQATVEQVVGSISDVVLAGAQVKEVWYDETGRVSRQGMTYALACMPTDRSVQEFAEKLAAVAPEEDNKDRIERVKENARLAFEELEAMEDKKANQ